MKQFVILGLLSLSLTACGGSAETATDGDDLAAYEGPVTSQDAEAGKAAFEDTCSACHSESENPIANLAWSPAKVRKQIREGDDEMPAIPASRLSDEDLEHVLAFLATMGTVTN